MRHGKKINHLGRQHSHREALLSNMSSSLILNKRINTTVAKAKALRKYVEPLITKSKDDNTHSRRVVFGYLQNKNAVAELFREVAPKVADRPGGYTRIIKLETRPGDNADMCMMELVDFNTIYGGEGKTAGTKKAKSTRRRSGKKSTAGAENETAPETAAPSAEAKKKPAAKKKDTSEETAPKKTRSKKSDSGDKE
jgi:large subunit ribosomal protein L17